MTPQPTVKQLRAQYLAFLRNPPKDEFSRWIEEFKYTSDLIERGKRAGLIVNSLFIKQRKKAALEHLKRFGLKDPE